MAGTKTWAVADVLTAADLNGYLRDQWITICTSGTRPTTSQTGRHIYETDTKRCFLWNGSAWAQITGQWVTWTTTFTNLSLGNGTFVGRMKVTEGEVHLQGKCTFGSTTSISGGSVSFTIPATPSVESLLFHGAFDVSATQGFTGWSNPAGLSGHQIFGPNTVGSWAATVPFTWAVGDFLWISGTYPI